MLEIKIQGCNIIMRTQCCLCNSSLETDFMRTVVAYDNGELLGDVCDECVKRGEAGLRVMFERDAKGRITELPETMRRIRKQAEHLQELARGPIQCLTVEELEAARFQSEIDYCFPRPCELAF